MHNCFETELYVGLYLQYEDYGKELIRIREKCNEPTKEEEKKFGFIFGVIKSRLDNCNSKNMQLGVLSWKLDKSLNSLLILNTIYYFPEKIQVCIISEAFRISKKVYFQNEEKCSDKIKTICRLIGYSVVCEQQGEYILVKLDKKIGNALVQTILPDISQPEKRIVFFWLIKKLIDMGKLFSIRDTKNIEKICEEDFALKEKDCKEIERCINIGYNSQFYEHLYLLSIFNNKKIGFNDVMETILINDTSKKIPSEISKAQVVSGEMLSSISLSCAVDILKEKEINMTNQYDFICFMETSYEDDNMDLLLNTFCRLKENKNDLKVVLKMPEYETQYKYVYPLHNSASKEEKLFM